MVSEPGPAGPSCGTRAHPRIASSPTGDVGPLPCPVCRAGTQRRPGSGGEAAGPERQLLGELCGFPEGTLPLSPSPHLKSGQPVHVAGKGGAGEGRQGHRELSGRGLRCDVTSSMCPAVPSTPRVMQPVRSGEIQSSNQVLGGGWWDLVLTFGSVWPVGGTNRKGNQQSAGTRGYTGRGKSQEGFMEAVVSESRFQCE